MEQEYYILNKIKSNSIEPYKVPDDYFINLISNILLKISLQNKTYKVPENYFENLSSQIINKVTYNNTEIKTELESIAPLLSTISNKTPYFIPDNYFNSIAVYLPVSKTKIVEFKSTRNWIKYAVAASAIFIVAIFSLLVNKNSNEELLALHNQSLKINVEKSIQNINDDDLNNLVINNKAIVLNILDETSVAPFLHSTNIQSDINYLTIEEIEAYFEENKIKINNSVAPNS